MWGTSLWNSFWKKRIVDFPFQKVFKNKIAAYQCLFVESDGTIAFLPLFLLPDYKILFLMELLLFIMGSNRGARAERSALGLVQAPISPAESYLQSCHACLFSKTKLCFLLFIPLLSFLLLHWGVGKWQSHPSLGWRPRAAIHWVGAGPVPSFQTKTGWEPPCKVGIQSLLSEPFL